MNSYDKHIIVAFLLTFGLLLFDIMEYLDGNFGTLTEREALEIQAVSFLWVFMVMAILNRRNIWLCALLYSIGWAGYSIITTISDDLTHNKYFFYLVLADAASIGSVLCTIGFALKYPHNATRLIIFAGIESVSSFLPWVLNHLTSGTISIFDPELIYYFPSIISGCLYISFMARSEILDLSPRSEMSLRLSRVESGIIIRNEAYMPMDDVRTMLGLDLEAWEFFEDGLVERTCNVTIIGQTLRKWKVTVKKWRGEDFLRAIVSPVMDADGNNGFAFDIVSYHFTEKEGKGYVRIYGHDGMFIELYTENPSVDKENLVSRGFDHMVKEF